MPVELNVLYTFSNIVLPANTDGYSKLFIAPPEAGTSDVYKSCLLYTSDAADE